MNKVIKVDEFGDVVRTDNPKMWSDFIKSMTKTNTFVPAIDRVIFNLKTTETRPVKDADGNDKVENGKKVRETVRLDKPVLGTTVYFTDGTKVSVVNSSADVVRTTMVKVDPEDKNSPTVEVADPASKEAGIVYAIVKRLFGSIGKKDKNGQVHENEIDGNGFGRKLREISDAAYDTQLETATNELQKVRARKMHLDREAKAKENRAKRRPTLEANVNEMVTILRELVAKQA